MLYKLTKLVMKPFLKWVGGKTQIMPIITEKIPKTMNNYHEPFLGGGSVLLSILNLEKNGKLTINGTVYASDSNESLIELYKNIQTVPDEVCDYVLRLKDEYHGCSGDDVNRNPQNISEALKSKENYYYWMRNKFNQLQDKTTIEASAIFLFLNKTGFRGMYREGPNGFNIPYGHYKKTPSFVDKEHIIEVSKLIQNVVFTCSSFEESLESSVKDDFIYADPPYVPLNTTSFVKYNAKGFGKDQHETLFAILKSLTDSKFLMSNSSAKVVYDSFSGYAIEDVICRRAINSKNPGSTVKEVLIKNYTQC